MPYTQKYLKERMRKEADPSSTLIMVYESLTNAGRPPAPPLPPDMAPSTGGH